VPIHKLTFPDRTFPGQTVRQRDMNVKRLFEALKVKVSEEVEESVEKQAIEIEAQCFSNNKLEVAYQNSITSRLRKLKSNILV
jgi:hypothetical protein